MPPVRLEPAANQHPTTEPLPSHANPHFIYLFIYLFIYVKLSSFNILIHVGNLIVYIFNKKQVLGKLLGSVRFYLFIWNTLIFYSFSSKIVSENDQKIPQSQTADKPMAP